MNRRRCARCSARRALVIVVVLAGTFAGCAAMTRSAARSTEELLTVAGFEMLPADTTERQQRLTAMPRYRLETRTRDGAIVYTYADPDRCRCVYVGGPTEYAAYQWLRAQQEIEQDDTRVETEAATNSIWGPWMW
jgi:hypothetical protein